MEVYMSKGKRYEGEPKLNLKKVFAVIIAIAVIIMFVIGIKKLMTPSDKSDEKQVAIQYLPVYTNNKWGVINSSGDIIIEPTYDEMIVIPDTTKAVFICTYDVDYTNGTYRTKILNEKNEKNKLIAETITNHLKEKMSNIREIKKDNTYYMYKHISSPGILIEAGFISNPSDNYLLRNEEYQDKLIIAISEGIEKYFKNN